MGTAEAGTGAASSPSADEAPKRRRSVRDWPLEAVAPALLLTVFAVLLCLVLARPTPLTQFDVWVRDHVERVSRVPQDGMAQWFWIRRVSDLGNTIPAIPAMAVFAIGSAALRRTWRPILAAVAAYAVLGGAVVGLKVAIGRPGPEESKLNTVLGYFPSGHTANTLLCYGTCSLILASGLGHSPTARRARVVIAAGMTALALGMGFSLVWLDFHWVSDVLGSYTLCGAALFGIAWILRTEHLIPARRGGELPRRSAGE